MSSTGSTEFISCAVHNDQATAVCLKHKFLLCTDCLLNSVHSKPDCDRKKIKNLDSRYESALVRFLALKQDVAESKEKNKDFIKEIQDKGGDIKNKIINFHDELVKRLVEFKDAALDSLETNVESAISSREEILSKIEDVEVKVADKINTLQEGELDGTNEELKQHKKVLSEADKKAEVNAVFKRSTELEGILTVLKDMGKIGFFVQEHYVDIVEPMADKQEFYTGSDIYPAQTIKPEGKDAPPVPPRPTQSNDETNEKQSGQDVGCKGAGAKPKEAKKKGGFFPWGSNKKDLPKSNKAVNLKTLKDYTFAISQKNEGRSFEKMMLFDQDKLVMLDKKQKEIAIVSTDGKTLARNKLKLAPVDFVITDSAEIIVLVTNNQNEVKLNLVEFTDGRLTQASTITQKDIALPVLGIDYKKNDNTDVFAITGNGIVTILEATEGAKSGEYKLSSTKTFPSSEHDLSKALAIYDFPTDSVFLLNAERKTMKRFLFEKKEFEWGKRLSDGDIVPNAMTKGCDYLYIACSNLIAKFNVKDGQQCKRSKLNLSGTFTNVTGICVEEKDKVAIVIGDTESGSQLAIVEL